MRDIMVGLVERRMSRSAIWSYRLAVFAVPYFPLAIVIHRTGNITSSQVISLLAVGFVILALSFLFAIRALIQLWNGRSSGGKKTAFGLFLSLTMLMPFLIFAVLAQRHPAINDVSTNILSPPKFSPKTIALRRMRGVVPANGAEGGYDNDEEIIIITSYPNLSPRRYPAGPERVLKAVKMIIKDRGWDITDIRGLSEPIENVSADNVQGNKEPATQTKNANSQANEDNGLEAVTVPDIFVDAVGSTALIAFKNDVVIKIVSEEQNTLVEMRSASRWGKHDFGDNARVIDKFMGDLDQSLIGIAGEG
jgi:hypothetical protein